MTTLWKNLTAKVSLGLMIGLAAAAGLRTAQAAGWKIETIDSSGVGDYSSLRIDKNGDAHVAYVVEDGTHMLKYGFWDHNLQRWFTMPVAGEASFCSLALDSKQHPHISYADFGTGGGARLEYAHWDGTAWQKQSIPLDSDIIAYYTSIALDSNDWPTISFYEYRGRVGTDFHIRLRAVRWNGQFWEVRTVDGDEGSGKFNSMAADSHGQIRLAYANVGALTAGVRYAKWDGKQWQTEVVDDFAKNQGQTVGYSIAMALDKDGNPHMSYWNINVPLIKYATWKDGKWLTEVVDYTTSITYWDRNSIALDEQGRPYMAYYDGGQGELRMAHREGGKWVKEVVASQGAGFTSSMQIDHGVVWITFADEKEQSLKLARLEIGGATPAVQQSEALPAAKGAPQQQSASPPVTQ